MNLRLDQIEHPPQHFEQGDAFLNHLNRKLYISALGEED